MEKKGKDRGANGKFKKGNSGGPGGNRRGAGRPPKPSEGLLKKLYDMLEKNAPGALRKLEEQIEHDDPKVAQKACQIILSKILPERSAHESWQSKELLTSEEHSQITQFFALKIKQDVERAKEEEKKGLRLVKGKGN